MEKNKIRSVRDLDVYKKLFSLNHEVYKLTLEFPVFEKYELGSQLRRAANSAPANIAEGWNNKHLNIYIEGLNRALSEVHEVEHHLSVAFQRQYVNSGSRDNFLKEYDECGRMLKGLIRALESSQS